MQLAVAVADLVVAEDVRAFHHVLAIADPAAAAVDAAPWPQAHASLPAAAASAADDETDDAGQAVHPAHCAWADRNSRRPAANINISLPRSTCQHQRLLSFSISASSAYGQQAWSAELSASGVDNARVHPMVGTLRVASDATPHRAPVCVGKRNGMTIKTI